MGVSPAWPPAPALSLIHPSASYSHELLRVVLRCRDRSTFPVLLSDPCSTTGLSIRRAKVCSGRYTAASRGTKLEKVVFKTYRRCPFAGLTFVPPLLRSPYDQVTKISAHLVCKATAAEHTTTTMTTTGLVELLSGQNNTGRSVRSTMNHSDVTLEKIAQDESCSDRPFPISSGSS